MTAATTTIETQTLDAIAESRIQQYKSDGGYSPDKQRMAFAQWLSGNQNVSLQDAETAVNKAEIKLGITPVTPQPEQPVEQTAEVSGGNVSAVERSESERACRTPFDGAVNSALRGIPQIPLQVKLKKTLLMDWQNLASIDVEQIKRWEAELPGRNYGSVAKTQSDGIWIFDIDDADAVKQRISETQHKLSELKTYQVRSSPKKGHTYFRHNAKSLALAAEKAYISVKGVNGKDELCSARLNNAYVVSAGSIHPDTKLPYQVVTDADISEAPDWLLEWIRVQHVESEKLPLTARLDGPKIARGSHDNELTRIAGKLRQDGMEEESIASALIEICEKRCEDYGSDYQEMCQKIAHSIGKKPIVDTRVFHNGVPVEVIAQEIAQQKQTAQAAAVAEETEPEIDDTGLTPRPVFPTYVMEGTSLYEHLVKPVVSTSSKYPELVFMPGVLMFMNAIALRVRLAAHRSVPNMFLGLISPYGKFYKSSSCEAALDYFKKAGFAASYSMKVPSVAVMTLILSPGSPEGAALQMKRINGPKAVFYYDELGSFCAKASIEHSAMLDKMLSWYEAKEDGNQIKANQSSYHFESGKYCFSWLWCTTDRKLPALWSKLTGSDSGLNNRMFFLLSPEEPRESGLYSEPEFDVTLTKKLLDQAFIHNPVNGMATYDYEDLTDTAMKIKGLDPRSQSLFEHLALYFAIDLGRDEIDADCCERALKLVEYRNSVEAYLDLFQADTKEAAIPHEIIRELRRNHGKMKYRDLYHDLHAIDRLYPWNRSISLLCGEGLILIREHRESKGKGGEQVSKMIYLLKERD